MKRLFGILTCFSSLVLGCDLPPEEDQAVPGDTDTDTASETVAAADTADTESTSSSENGDSEGDSEPPSVSCVEGMLCLIDAPLNADGCLSGMDPETQEAASALAACAFMSCLDQMDNTGGLVLCLAMSCSAETMACAIDGLGDLEF
jgi:hypothetical protein